ncbi:MAG: lysylphosphatidylglycerol synthase transmembrane domain-containing protein [Phycisphaerales bacterium]
MADHAHRNGRGGRGRKRALFAAKLTVSVSLLVFVLSRADIGAVWNEIRSSRVSFLLLALLTPFGGYYFTSLRWKGLLRVAGVRVSQWPLFRASILAIFFNQLLPSTIGGDIARMYEAWRAGAPKAIAVSSLLIDRVIGIFALALLAVGAVPFVRAEFERPELVFGLVGVIAFGVTGVLAMVFAPVPAVLRLFRAIYGMLPGAASKIFRKLDTACEGYRGNVPAFALALLFSFAIQLNVVLMHWLIAVALDIPVGYDQLMFVVPIALIVMLAPISINGIGLREGIFAVLLAAYGVAQAEAVALALLSYAVFLVHGMLGGVVFALRGVRLKQIEAVTETPSGPPPPSEVPAPTPDPTAG